jgi:transcriptional regulator with XRE-family HTH domain
VKGRHAVNVDDAHIGRRVRQIRHARGKSLSVAAGLAGISKSYLAMIERGERALDRRSLIAALATALEVAPTDITGGALATPGQAEDDRTADDVRQVLLAVNLGEPRGEVQPIEALRTRVADILTAQNNADSAAVGAALPSLIRDLHATSDANPNQPEIQRLLTLAHMQGTQAWLTMIGAPTDLSWQAATLARHAAERLDEPVWNAVSTYGTTLGLLSAGAFDLAARTVSTVDLNPLATVDNMQIAGSLALASSLVSAARNDQTEQSAALQYAADLAKRTGETNVLGFGFGPSNVAVWRMQGALETGDHAEAAKIAQTVNPNAIPVRARQAVYWREYGRALAHLPRRRDDAVLMLRRAERISPEHVHRHPFTRSTIAELLARANRDAVGRELRGMAYRAGLPV